MNLKPLVMLAAFSIAGACSKHTPPADSLPLPASASTSVAADAGPPVADLPKNALADFTVEPGEVFACDGRDRVISTVKWQVKDPSVATVKVEVDSAQGSERQTFAAGGNVGEARTGEWVVAGVRFHLIDGATNKELASYEVTSLPCQ